jgi:hypothetical protein
MDGGVTLNRTEMIPECRQQMPTGVSHGLFEYRILVNRQIADVSPVDYTLSDLYPAFNIYVAIGSLGRQSHRASSTGKITPVMHRAGRLDHTGQTHFTRMPSSSEFGSHTFNTYHTLDTDVEFPCPPRRPPTQLKRCPIFQRQ